MRFDLVAYLKLFRFPLVFTAIATAQQYVKTNRLVGVGVPSAKRSSALPDVQTFQESGLAGFDVSSWVGIMVPAKTPRPIVDRLYRELEASLKTPFVRERYATLGIEPVGNTPRQFGEEQGRVEGGRVLVCTTSSPAGGVIHECAERNQLKRVSFGHFGSSSVPIATPRTPGSASRVQVT